MFLRFRMNPRIPIRNRTSDRVMRHNNMTKWHRCKLNNELILIKLEWMTWNENIHSQKAPSIIIFMRIFSHWRYIKFNVKVRLAITIKTTRVVKLKPFECRYV